MHYGSLLIQVTKNGLTYVKEATYESLGMKNKWCRKRDIRKWNEEIAKVTEEKQNAFTTCIATKLPEDRIEYCKRRAKSQREMRRKHRESGTNLFQIWRAR